MIRPYPQRPGSGAGREGAEGAPLDPPPAPWPSLRVMTGVHAGASIPLSPGRYLMGGTDECDLIFSEAGFAQGALIIDLTGNDPVLCVSGGLSAQAGDRELTEAPRIAGWGTTVRIGYTELTFEPGRSPFPAAPGRPPASPRGPRGPGGRKALVVALGLAALLVPGALWSVHSFSGRVDLEKLAADLPGALQRRGLHSFRVALNPRGITVTGYAATDRLKDEISASLAKLDPRIGDTLWSEEGMRRAAHQVFELYQLDFRVETLPGGVLAVHGVLDDAPRMQEVMEALKQDVPGLKAANNRVIASSSLAHHLVERLAGLAWGGKIRFEMDEKDRGRLDAFLLRGSLDSAELRAWGELKETLGDDLKLEIREAWTDRVSQVLFKTTRAEMEPDTDLMSVTTGARNHITLKNGRRYAEGMRLASGRLVKLVRQDRIVLEKDGREEGFYLRGVP